MLQVKVALFILSFASLLLLTRAADIAIVSMPAVRAAQSTSLSASRPANLVIRRKALNDGRPLINDHCPLSRGTAVQVTLVAGQVTPTTEAAALTPAGSVTAVGWVKWSPAASLPLPLSLSLGRPGSIRWLPTGSRRLRATTGGSACLPTTYRSVPLLPTSVRPSTDYPAPSNQVK